MDLTFQTMQGRFNYRVGAIIIDQGKLCLITNDQASYYWSIGGRVKYNETSREAIEREIYEELGIHMEIDRPLFLHEQFFNESDSKVHFHEISIYFLMKINGELKNIQCHSQSENGLSEHITWIPLCDLHKYKIYPLFLKTELLDLPIYMKHIIERE